MALFFRGAVTSSPIKTRSLEAEHICHSLDSSYECFSTNPLTGSVCACRRSPRLLANGYYVLTEDSFSTDEEGNVTLTPSQTSVSYKENLVRIFRRRRRAKRSLASLLSDMSQSCQSWLEGSVFRRSDPITPLQSSLWEVEELDHSYEKDTPISFTYDPTDPVPSPDKVGPQTQLEEEEPQSEACSAHEQFSQSVSGLLDVPPPSMCHLNSYSPSSKTSSDTVLLKVLLLTITLCLCIAISSRWLLGGVSVAVAFFVLLSSLCMSKSGTVRWRKPKAEDITSRNE
ncbi:transmembrane protein 71-like [Myxocyprinus asiaticus]|uniref:transmembrane protein 71-like n=1 Tax=Myxocyprinus asiaticus TaxID=70543 RepID=UPI0022227602|nr:transmembrane protein 71-like [Myxocyprinus asiaticus]XP_051556545.1 transmembrane protein 71-like [Myxocyprinus asiaticus]XP_051556546.1 transmembrane protein 71-like [Myxocyprinus asiaticus]XP_051556547.1 transmembrane protein 71-like [Myxocyprinus asiaticus]XP_051556548.1 transmembrane protein 71-like [Myxocyprinus asiaticus]XP_051556549.1 transmembrane protein 71-like [Myxocyprinus asiaticus]XP_051556550.1 transmembrane protein 71-like [Myxocyprinus asiaticus]